MQCTLMNEDKVAYTLRKETGHIYANLFKAVVTRVLATHKHIINAYRTLKNGGTMHIDGCYARSKG